ncbi:hypothetical protein TRV_00024 [Trichophyton verrucosum HKI 0517]|uniref:Uncharacterized protein n=1 Tax=Trichophyton verrucosum (strain HKI 0517) TaxID=663202 RepID=D4CYY7_TRIVH|nr:uncharacterized protein TRV_00024 [Trichophyton verrucosum HKI 0517]EFE45151.1 hypothetical protein TRV_00024 [Trichophyton verrucosum HKI 0517]
MKKKKRTKEKEKKKKKMMMMKTKMRKMRTISGKSTTPQSNARDR